MESSPCGPQPRWNNFTIAATGWELTPATNCYWKDNMININGIPHEYLDETWQELTGKITLGTLTLVHTKSSTQLPDQIPTTSTSWPTSSR